MIKNKIVAIWSFSAEDFGIGSNQRL